MNDDLKFQYLRQIFELAYAQAATGKGKERHNGRDLDFTQQQIVEFGLEARSIHYQLGQADKKIREALRLDSAKARHEILGAINFLAAAYIVSELLEQTPAPTIEAQSYKPHKCKYCKKPYEFFSERLNCQRVCSGNGP